MIEAIQRFLRPPSTTAAERAQRAVTVRALLDDPTIQDAILSIQSDLIGEWTRAGNADERENLWRAVNVLDRLQTWLRSAAAADLTALRRVK